MTLWNAALAIWNSMPWQVAQFLAGWVGSIAVTHPVKVGLRRYTLIDVDNRHLIAWITAVVSAASMSWAYGLAQVPPAAAPAAVAFVAVFTGIWSPLAFAGLQRFLRASPEIGKRKGFGWVPDLTGVADWLSGDVGPSKGGDNAR